MNYERYFVNYTEEDVTITDLGITITAQSSSNLFSEGATPIDISSSDDLLSLLGQGIDNYQIVEGNHYYGQADGIRLCTQISGHPIETDEFGYQYVYSTPRPKDCTTFFTGASDGASGCCYGETVTFSLSASDTEVYKDYTFNEKIWMKDGWFAYHNAPWGACVCVEIHHPYVGVVNRFLGKIPVYGNCEAGVYFNSEDRGGVEPPLFIRIRVRNSETEPADFKLWGFFEMFRENTV